MLYLMALVIADVSEKRRAYVIRVTRVGELGMLAVTSNRLSTTRRNIPEGGFLHSHRREHLKFYMALTGWTLYWRINVSCEVRTGFLYPRKRHSS
jgi:hypothetical protein